MRALAAADDGDAPACGADGGEVARTPALARRARDAPPLPCLNCSGARVRRGGGGGGGGGRRAEAAPPPAAPQPAAADAPRAVTRIRGEALCEACATRFLDGRTRRGFRLPELAGRTIAVAASGGASSSVAATVAASMLDSGRGRRFIADAAAIHVDVAGALRAAAAALASAPEEAEGGAGADAMPRSSSSSSSSEGSAAQPTPSPGLSRLLAFTMGAVRRLGEARSDAPSALDAAAADGAAAPAVVRALARARLNAYVIPLESIFAPRLVILPIAAESVAPPQSRSGARALKSAGGEEEAAGAEAPVPASAAIAAPESAAAEAASRADAAAAAAAAALAAARAQPALALRDAAAALGAALAGAADADAAAHLLATATRRALLRASAALGFDAVILGTSADRAASGIMQSAALGSGASVPWEAAPLDPRFHARRGALAHATGGAGAAGACVSLRRETEGSEGPGAWEAIEGAARLAPNW
jgi:hypothetical protein